MAPSDPLSPDALVAPSEGPQPSYPLAPSPEDETVKVAKEEVAYGHPPKDIPNNTCSRCSNYEGSYRCTLVQGDIMPDGWCTEWSDGFREPGSKRRGNPQKSETTTAAAVGTGPVLPLGSSIRHRSAEDEDEEDEEDEKEESRSTRPVFVVSFQERANGTLLDVTVRDAVDEVQAVEYATQLLLKRGQVVGPRGYRECGVSRSST